MSGPIAYFVLLIQVGFGRDECLLQKKGRSGGLTNHERGILLAY